MLINYSCSEAPKFGPVLKPRPCCKRKDNDVGVIQNYALPFSSVIGTGLYASLRASDTGPIFLLEEEPRSFELHPLIESGPYS